MRDKTTPLDAPILDLLRRRWSPRAFDPTPVTNHVVNLNGLLPGQRYNYRALSITDGTPYASECSAIPFTTTNFASGELVPLNASWRYTTNNLDGVNWTAPEYEDGGWSNGPACLWASSSTLCPPSRTTRDF